MDSLPFKSIKRKYVEGSGPFDARILWVGEAPGRHEEERGEPFIGYTGRVIRRGIRDNGLSDTYDVRWDNALPYNMTIPREGARRRQLIDRFKSHLDSSLMRTKYDILVACGEIALQRLYGITGIKKEHGGVIPVQRTTFHPAAHPGDALLIPILHPAGIMRTKIWAEMLSVQRVIRRITEYACGERIFEQFDPPINYDPPPYELDIILAGASEVVIDTEFDRVTKEPFLIGLLTDNDCETVISLSTPLNRYSDVLRKHFNRTDLLKIAHFIGADVGSLLYQDIDTTPPWADTLAAFATLYPDLPRSLSYMSRFYLDNVRNWKDMAHDDPLYNALDVWYTWRCWLHLKEELNASGQWDLFQDEVMPAVISCWAMEERGIPVSVLEQERLASQWETEQIRLTRSIISSVGSIFSERVRPLLDRLEEVENEIKSVQSQSIPAPCIEHAKYNGLVKPRGKDKGACTCLEIFETRNTDRERIARLRKERNSSAGKVKRWDAGFVPTNNDHLRWLLYDKNGFNLPKQRKEGRITADANAIKRLITLKSTQRIDGAVDLLKQIKRVQHLAKIKSTFLFPPVDENNIAHPPMRPWGAGTGRPAGGSDPDTSDKRASEYSFNPLNIPDETRSIFVPEN